MILYHYRTIESALFEIRDGTFYFATREQLNDPIEGYVHVFWQGDKIAWQGLFRNYICSALRTFIRYAALADKSIPLTDKLVIRDIHYLENKGMGDLFQEAGDAFLLEERINQIAELYGNNNAKVEEKELQLILSAVHQKAIDLFLQILIDHKMVDRKKVKEIIEQHSIVPVDLPLELMRESFSGDEHYKQFAEEIVDTMKDIIELQFIKHGIEEDYFLYGNKDNKQYDGIQKRNWMLVTTDFPWHYIEQLKELMFPETYTVCFSKTNNNSSMWGNYADNHKGVCLIYETNSDNQITIDAKEQSVITVSYGGTNIERNFFETFGSLSNDQIKSWLIEKGKPSKYLNAFSKQDEWRYLYWLDFILKSHHKTKAWKHEEECRIVVYDLLKRPDSEGRIKQYDPKALKGVIFGIRTSEYDKMQIVKALNQRRNTIQNVRFYQAEFKDHSEELFIREKSAWV